MTNAMRGGVLAVVLSLSVAGAEEPQQTERVTTSKRGMVATVHPRATAAGVAALRNGGNAIDAAIAAALTLGVVDQHNSGLGGGCFILIRRADGKLFAIDGREMAPARATRDMYVRNGQLDPKLSQTGPLAVATPGALLAYAQAVQQHGKLKLAALLLPAARIAAEGFRLDAINAAKIKAVADDLRKFPASWAVLLKADGSPHVAGDVLVQADLAATYRAVAEHGTDWFYRGPFAEKVGKWMAENGGLLSAEDFANYRVVDRQPLVTKYRDFTIVGFPPPSSGGVHVAQILNILESFDLAAIHQRDPAEFAHLVAEAMKLAFADRAYWLGDPAFAKVPRGLIEKEYAHSLARKINPQRASAVPQHGQPGGAASDVFGKHTTHLTAADAEGNWVAITQTVNTTFGSKVIVPGTGVVLNDEMDDFSIQPGVPNAFGLIGAEANAIEPGKRPLSSMSPTIVLAAGEPIMTVGAAGGPTIISQVVLALIRRLDLKQSLAEAIRGPRWHQQWSPDELRVEAGLDEDLLAGLTARGHTLKRVGSMGVSQGITLDRATGEFTGVSDPRVHGQAAGP
jgi:gamma-glutamyltranspeptidase/glutathione hydrolase